MVNVDCDDEMNGKLESVANPGDSGEPGLEAEAPSEIKIYLLIGCGAFLYIFLCLVVIYTIKSCFKFTWFGNNYYTCSCIKNSLESSGLQPLLVNVTVLSIGKQLI